MQNNSDKINEVDRTIEQRYNTLLGVFDAIEPSFVMGHNGIILETNKAFAELFGKQVQEIINTKVFDLFPPELAAFRKSKADEALSTGKTVTFEDEHNGRLLILSFSPIADKEGKNTLLIITGKDITELKRIEKESNHQKIFSSAVIESIPGAFYMLDAKGRFVEWNTYERDMVIGKADHEIAGTFALETIHPDDRALAAEKVSNVIENGVEESEEIRVLLHGGPEFRWHRLSAKRITINNAPFLIGIGTDITEHKLAEDAALKQSEAHFQKFFEEHSSIMAVIDDKGNIIDANPAAAAFYGWSIEELCKLRLEQITLNSPEVVKAEKEKIRTSKQNVFSVRHRIADGSIHDVEVLVLNKTIGIKAEEVFYCIINDITARKRAEQALLSSERKFRSITEQMSEMVFVTDSSGYLTYVSPAAKQLLGYHPHEIIGHSFTDYLAGEAIPNALPIFHDTILHHAHTQVEALKFSKKNGSFCDAKVHFNFYHDKESSGMIGLIYDISDQKHQESIRKQYENELLDSQQFLKSIYDEVNHSIFVVDVRPDGGFRFKGINPIHEKLTGIQSDDIAGKTPEEFLDPEVAAAITNNYTTCIRENKTIQYEECLPFKGKESWWETTLNPVRNESGHIQRIIGTSINVTERKHTEIQLKKMSAAVEQSPTAVIITDPAGNIEYINPRFTRLTGYAPDEIIGKHTRMLESGLMPKSVNDELWETINSGEIWHGEFHNRKKNGDPYWEMAIIAPILNNDGVITNVVGIKEDITEQKQMLDELINAKEKAVESDRLKSAFLANISHEIRTPMNGILGFSELLKEPQLSGTEQVEYVDLIQQSGKRMLNLINDLIDISRIEAGETIPQITATPVNTLLSDLHSFFKPAAEKKELRLSCTTGLPDKKSIIETDGLKLNQILTNLVQNALKFTCHGGIDVGYTKVNDMLEFYVIDSGRGIPPDMTEKIFDRFRQADNSLTRAHEGSGLGLSISKAYVEMLGGTIHVESTVERGSKFIFTLPYNPPGSLKIEIPITVIQEPLEYLSGITILIAEDDEVSNFLLKKSLKGANLTILSVENGVQAVEMVKYHPEINLVLMDIKMPIMNGIDATRKIKQFRPDLPVIAQTAFASKPDREKAKQAGYDCFLTKPINKNNLLEMMRVLLNR